jgi:hypothetical protein
VNRTRHRMVTIELDCRRLELGHVVTEGQEEDLLRIIDPELKPRADDCACDEPPHLSASCRAGGCGLCLGFLEGNVTPCRCDCHPRGEQYQLDPADQPPNAAYLERWLTHWQARALKAEARVAGAHAQAVDARRRELAEAGRWRDCRTHTATIEELRIHVDRLNDVMDPYEQLRIEVIGVSFRVGEMVRLAKEAEPLGTARRDPPDVYAIVKHLGKLVDACNRGLEKATARSRAREESA